MPIHYLDNVTSLEISVKDELLYFADKENFVSVNQQYSSVCRLLAPELN